MVSQKTFTLNTGAKIPAVGLGTWQILDEDAYTAVKSAIAAGYRHIDTAFGYNNEVAVGRGIRDALAENGLERKDIFVTTKLWTTYSRPALVPECFNTSLERLDIGYIDLYLLHWPVAMAPRGPGIPRKADGTRDLDPETPFEATWAAMEKLLDTGRVKAIGVCNFSIPNLNRLLASAKVVPAVNQVELHPYLPQHELVAFCESKGIHVTAYSPLGSTGSPLLAEPVIVKIAQAHSRTPAQILISWAATRGSVVPKSTNPERIKSNVQTVELSQTEIDDINAIHKSHTQRFIRPDWGVPVFDEDF